MKVAQDAMQEQTGRDWQEWVAALDEWGATAHTYGEIARWMKDEHGVDDWWTQKIVVTYMGARGMRGEGEHGDGTFNANASKTVNVAAYRLYEAFADVSVRERWLPGATIRIRTSTPPRSLRADWADGTSRIAVVVEEVGPAKATIGLVHEKLPDAEAAVEMKAYWRARLTALKQLLEA
jgi:hypothetical protein